MRRAALVMLLFALSGAVGLAYEVVWFRRFSHVWGSSGVALAAVLGSFLGGLGLGAWLVGKLADVVRRPLLAYGLCEVGIGVLAWLVPYEIAWLAERSAAVHGWLSAWPPVAALGRSLVTFAVLGPPSFLLGGTLPLLLAFFGRDGSFLRSTAGGLYAVNTIGAAAGCFVTGFVLLPRLGLATTQAVAVAASLGVGLVAIGVDLARGRAGATGSRAAATEPRGDELVPDTDGVAPSAAAIGLAALLGGIASLVLEVVWTRQVAVLVGGSTYAFAAALSVYLLGIALGALYYHRGLRARGVSPLAPMWTVLWIVATTVLGRTLLPVLSDGVGLAYPLRSSFVLDSVIVIASSAAIELAPTFGMGLLFPLVLHVAAPAARRGASTLGRLYALNTVGAIVGAIAASVWLLPWIGSGRTTGLALLAYAVVLALLFPPLDSWRRSAALLCALTVAFVASFAATREGDPRDTQLGQYLYGFIAPDERPLAVQYFREGAHANVLVTSTPGGRSLRVNGKVDASTFGDMATQLGLAYLPLFVRPDSRQACVIGFGSGTTAGALLLAPDLHVTCAELEPAVVEAGVHFEMVNHQPTRSSRLRIALDDGRNFLASAEERFDLIISEPSNPWLAGVSNLFTREFYVLARARLARGGVLAQWIQCYAFDLADYALVVRTIRDVFPHAVLVRTSAEDTVLLASQSPILPTAGSCGRAQEIINASAEMQSDLLMHFGTRDVRELLLRHLLLDGEGIDRFLAFDDGTDLHTDLDLRLEFDAPRRLYVRREGRDRVDLRLLDAVRAGYHAELARAVGAGRDQAGALHAMWQVLADRSVEATAQSVAEAGLELDPAHRELLADLLISLPDDQGAESAARSAEILSRLVADESPEASSALARAGKRLFASNRDSRAEPVFRELVRRHPESATAWANLGNTLAALGRGEEAREALDRATTLDPLSAFARESSASEDTRD